MSAHGLLRKFLRSRLLLFSLCCSVIFLFYLWVSSTVPTRASFLRERLVEKSLKPIDPAADFKINSSKCLAGELLATAVGSGLGNIIFEVMTFLGTAVVSNRRPVIFHNETLKVLQDAVMPNFPNLYELLVENTETCGPGNATQKIWLSSSCCIYEDMPVKLIKIRPDDTVIVVEVYDQSYKYFTQLTKPQIDWMLEGSNKAIRHAEHRAKEDGITSDDKILCVHIRRGDFIKNTLALPSTKQFTYNSVKYVAKKHKVTKTYVFGNDNMFAQMALGSIENVHIVPYSDSNPINSDWVFAKRYCDITIVTASVSTYGWWMGFLSRGQIVYYNYEYSTPGGISKQLKADDFWPLSWTPLLLTNGLTNEIPRTNKTV